MIENEAIEQILAQYSTDPSTREALKNQLTQLYRYGFARGVVYTPEYGMGPGERAWWEREAAAYQTRVWERFTGTGGKVDEC